MPWVDFGLDIITILAGAGIRHGNRFIVKGREYVLEGGGRLIPIAGEGLVPLGRGVYRALGQYNETGLTVASELQLDRDLVREEEREVARQVRRALEEWELRQG